MSKILTSLFNYIEEPVLIYDTKHDKLFPNNAFKRFFYDFEPSFWKSDIRKLEYKMHFELCLLESEHLKTYTPIMAAIQSPFEFSMSVSYESFYFILKTVQIGSYKLIYFYDITKKFQLEKLEAENSALKEQAIAAPKAQNQAVKMALLNRISNSLRSPSLDSRALICVALKELSQIFGASKVYFAHEKNGGFEVEQSYPASKNKEVLVYDKVDKINFSITLKEHNNSTEHFSSPMGRIIMPILPHGIFVIFTPQKDFQQSEKELLVGVSNQISDAIELKEIQLQLINSEKMVSLGQLIANVAHEINTPLASISANNEIMQKLFQDELLIDMNSIDRIAIDRISNLVKSLKRFVRLDESNQQEADINAELDLTLELLKHKAKNSIEIVKNYGDIPLVCCYPNMLNQVFLNILSNAIDAIGGVGKITITTLLEGNNLVIKIQDNGVGISEESKAKIFEPGFTTKKIGEGTGLGLAICKKIIDKHNGSIDFIAQPGNTEFTIEIPIN